MATKIQETPLLIGKDAKRFIKQIEDSEKNRLSKEKREEIRSAYDKISKMVRF